MCALMAMLCFSFIMGLEIRGDLGLVTVNPISPRVTGVGNMMRKLSFVLGVLMMMALVPLSARARVAFCSSDPIYDVGGHQIQVVVELSPEETVYEITPNNPLRVHLTAPEGTNPKVMWVEEEPPQVATASEQEGLAKVIVTVTVPADAVSHRFTRVSIYKDGEFVCQKRSPHREMSVRFDW